MLQVGRPRKANREDPREGRRPPAAALSRGVPGPSGLVGVRHRRPGRSAFFRFAREHRPAVTARLSEARGGAAPDRKEVARALAHSWNDLTAEEKKVAMTIFLDQQRFLKYFSRNLAGIPQD